MGEAIKQHGPWEKSPLAPGHLFPTAELLSELREKFLSVFDVASILESRSLPSYIIHHDVADLNSSREPRGPVPGNDYHDSDPRIHTDPAAWDSKLRLEPWSEESGSLNLRPLIIPFKHITQHDQSDSDGVSKVEEAARLIRKFWPDDSIGSPRRRLVGRQLTDVGAPEYHIFHWLASKDLNGEGVSVTSLFPSPNGHFVCSHRDAAVAVLRDSAVEKTEASPKPKPPSETRPHGMPSSSAQIWSLLCTSVDSPISFPILATILCLLSKPNKQKLAPNIQESAATALSTEKFADKDISWCLDSLHGFSRRQTPCYQEHEKCLSFALGTSPDCWMHFHFVFHFYEFDPDPPQDQTSARGSGLQFERGSFSLPVELGGDQHELTFNEKRIWLGMRVATNYCGEKPNVSPSAVGVILSDMSHGRLNATAKTWESERRLASPQDAPGVALFQMTLWTQLDRWEMYWNRCLDNVDSVFKTKLETQADVDRLDRIIDDAASRSSRTCTRIIMLLLNFRYQMETVVKSIKQMYGEWERTYPGEHTERHERFTVETQKALLGNWEKILSFLDKVNARLGSRIDSSINELRLIRECHSNTLPNLGTDQ